MHMVSLPDLALGQRGVVKQIERNMPLADRLIELGFFPGADVRRLYSDRTESISAYIIADTCIALRRKDAACVRVEAR